MNVVLPSSTHVKLQRDSAPPLAGIERITAALHALGAISLEQFASNGGKDYVRFNPPPPVDDRPIKEGALTAARSALAVFGPNSLGHLNLLCEKTCGSLKALRFDYAENPTGGSCNASTLVTLNSSHSTARKGCTLTITRPDGKSQSYTAPIEYNRKTDAKNQSIRLAIEGGIVDFLSHKSRSPSPEPDPLAPDISDPRSQAPVQVKQEQREALDGEPEDPLKLVEYVWTRCRGRQGLPRPITTTQPGPDGASMSFSH